MPKETKSQAEHSGVEPTNLNFPKAPKVNSSIHKLHDEEEGRHPAVNQALLAGIAGLSLIGLVWLLIAIAVPTNTESPTNKPLVATSIELANIEGASSYSQDNTQDWKLLDSNNPPTLQTGSHIQTDTGSRMSLEFSNGSSLRIDGDSHIRIRSLNPLQTTVDLYSGQVYGQVNSQSDSFKLKIGDATYSSKDSSFLAKASLDEHDYWQISGQSIRIDQDSDIINGGETINETGLLGIYNTAPMSSFGFLEWNRTIGPGSNSSGFDSKPLDNLLR